MRDFLALLGALLVNLVLLLGLMYLPPVGIQSLENIYVFVWLSFGLLINLAYLRRALKLDRRRRTPAARRRSPVNLEDSREIIHRRRRQPLA